MNRAQNCKCQYCGITVANDTVLRTHMRTNQDCLKTRSTSAIEPVYKCGSCLKLFSSQAALEIHAERNSCPHGDNSSTGGFILRSPKYTAQHNIVSNIDKAERRCSSNVIRSFLRDYENGTMSSKELRGIVDHILSSSS